MPLVPGTFEVLAASPGTLRAMLLGLPDDVITAQSAEAWSPRDVVIHLASRQRPALLGRVRAIVEQERPVLPDIPDDVAVAGFEMPDAPLDALISDFAATREEALVLINSLSDDQLMRTGRHETAGDVSAADIVHHIAYHDLVHIAQINEMLRGPIDRARGAMRRFV